MHIIIHGFKKTKDVLEEHWYLYVAKLYLTGFFWTFEKCLKQTELSFYPFFKYTSEFLIVSAGYLIVLIEKFYVLNDGYL